MKYTIHYGEQLLRLYSVLLYQPYYTNRNNRDWRNGSSMTESLDGVIVNRVIVHLCLSGFLGHELGGWRCRLGKLVLPMGLASLGHGAWWMTGCTGRLPPPEMDRCADRPVPQRAAVYEKRQRVFSFFKKPKWTTWQEVPKNLISLIEPILAGRRGRVTNKKIGTA